MAVAFWAYQFYSDIRDFYLIEKIPYPMSLLLYYICCYEYSMFFFVGIYPESLRPLWGNKGQEQ